MSLFATDRPAPRCGWPFVRRSVPAAARCAVVVYLIIGLGWLLTRATIGWNSVGVPASAAQDASIPKLHDEVQPADTHHPAPLASPEQHLRRAQIAHCLSVYFEKPVDADRLRPWSMMHGLIAYGQRSQLRVGGELVNAAEYLCLNGAGNNVRILSWDAGRLDAKIGPGVQGHPGQLLAILAQAGVPADHPLAVDGQDLTLVDLIEYEMRGCKSKTELTFRLIALTHYLEPHSVWVNEAGEKWSLARLVSEECQQPIEAGACGGTHRLMALSRAIRQLEEHQIPLTGPWLQADRITNAYEERAWRYQNPNGSFSTQFFNGTGRDADLTRRVYAHGHILEWLAYKLPENRLTEPRLLAAVDYLVHQLMTAPGLEIDVGPRGHALHALAIYYQRAFGESLDAEQLRAVAHSVPATERIPAQSAKAVALPAAEPHRPAPSPRPILRRR